MNRYKTIEEFHRARRMFAILSGTVLIARPGMVESHLEWLSGLCGCARAERLLTHSVRGYVLDGELRAYAGPEFSGDVNPDDAFAAFLALQGVVPLQWIAFGAVKAPGVIVWPAQKPAVPVWRWAGEQAARAGNGGVTPAP
jgi:hypothetical protein